MQNVFLAMFLLCFGTGAWASAVSHANSLAKSTSYDGDMMWFAGKSYGCELGSSSATYEYSGGDIIQALDNNMYSYECVDVTGPNDKWERRATRYCSDSPIKSISMKHTKICVYQNGKEQKCKIQGEYFDNKKWEAYKNGCVRVECVGDTFVDAKGACQTRMCDNSPEGTVLANQECATNVITDSNAVFCTKTCTYRENPKRMVWVNLISECKKNYKPSDDGHSCVLAVVRANPNAKSKKDSGTVVEITNNNTVEKEAENVETLSSSVENKSPCELGTEGWLVFEGACITNEQYQQILEQREATRVRALTSQVDNLVSQLGTIQSRFGVSVWKDADGKFNTARLASDGIAGVVLGTTGALVTSHVVKKNQVENGFEDIKCTVAGQVAADWGDEFSVGVQ